MMTQDERWIIRYNEVMDFMEKNHRRPSKYNMEPGTVMPVHRHHGSSARKNSMDVF